MYGAPHTGQKNKNNKGGKIWVWGAETKKNSTLQIGSFEAPKKNIFPEGKTRYGDASFDRFR
ncbi:MAG: hypothetical protein A3B74_00105 [Candidatus Kerfeldbacteria bacterium RIFCSPHIGHO2_02_FULL_42_14]|uniref:Uncharacterized protein n=1 Tax=Candidatus Kerfeldbacteria bacterium RIFCSPHIGHO2_02_FULL_42_14 TaxID=1798540 RepID=A0A1G2AQQ7_9BACT|nr:MAG: hypothetical protein A3B74_00105 [Candidatus Kerfeldbacteria bacterium RIFCSPHIGHO2_02_FULL_42_14]OGY81321.1 MAG: hypothetical protein A3E60_02635 [Candidatus Kerfeldbacteria bacterium RIFCSPHIGHO2_12_FULL_42_13]OGY83595.1 MAG: hypothetical protein A3I91_03065 [Candidatus Kerfeldbacteria bacterium RIFCSPLOWO2_02_FULL_42_19]OGY86691.1 MAG: hypothetical protein A3G01_00560 [Candidatus Kerfeldbacteria bacterium RIFCSPLOWO2_12_FULL_43_9]